MAVFCPSRAAPTRFLPADRSVRRLASKRPVGLWTSNDRSVWHGSCTLYKNRAGPSGSLSPNYRSVGWGSNYRQVGWDPNYLRVGCRSNDRAHGSARRTIGQDGRSPSGCQHPSAPSTIRARSAPSGPLQVPCRSIWHGSCRGVKPVADTVPAPSFAGPMPINMAWILFRRKPHGFMQAPCLFPGIDQGNRSYRIAHPHAVCQWGIGFNSAKRVGTLFARSTRSVDPLSA